MIKYKLTTQDLRTHNDFQWEVGKEVTTLGTGNLCSAGWLHYYHHPLLAVLLNPIHANFENPILWEVECNGDHKDDRGLKGGCTSMKLIKQLELTEITTKQRIAFGILCTLKVYKNKEWVLWANNWLNNIDRSGNAAANAYAAANAAAYAAYAAANAYAAKADNLDLIAISQKAMEFK